MRKREYEWLPAVMFTTAGRPSRSLPTLSGYVGTTLSPVALLTPQGRLGQPRSFPITQYLVSVITEWAKPLCFTSNGNYLCQQLLEKCTVDDKINLIKVIE